MKAVFLYPKLQNHWVVALPGATGSMREREQKALTWFEVVRHSVGIEGDFEQLEVTGSQEGHPEAIQAQWVQKDTAATFPADTTFVAIAFTYTGDKETGEWPELGNIGSLYGVSQAIQAVHVPTDWELAMDNFKRTGKQIADDAKQAAPALTNQLGTWIGIGIAVGVGALIFSSGRRR